MSMILIEGHFEVLGAAPDGDSVRFYPNKKEDWRLIREGKPVLSNKRGGAQLRLDGIDTLETHYSSKFGVLGITHQPRELAQGASSELLKWLGFHDVKRDANEKVTAAKPDHVDGYILTRFADTYGRCVAFAFKGKHPKKTGEPVYLDTATLKQSLNYHQLAEGHAYPTYYSKLYYDIRGEMTKAVESARTAHKSLWAHDLTMKGFTVPLGLDKVQQQAVILPKLFRRMIDYFALEGGGTSVDGLKEYLASLEDDRVFVLSLGQVTGFDTMLEVEGHKVRLTKPPEDLVFQEK